MLNLFDHMRGNWYKYLLEVIVIVAGILLAIWLENWNEERKERKIELRYQERLLLDFREDSLVLSQEIADLNDQILVIDSFLNVLNGQTYSSPPPIRRWLGNIMSINTASRANATFQDLVSSGQTKILSDELLIELLYTYYNEVEETESKAVESSITYGRDTFNPYIMKLMPVFTDRPDFDRRVPTLAALAEDNYFLSILGFKRILVFNQEVRYERQLELVNALIQRVSPSNK